MKCPLHCEWGNTEGNTCSLFPGSWCPRQAERDTMIEENKRRQQEELEQRRKEREAAQDVTQNQNNMKEGCSSAEN